MYIFRLRLTFKILVFIAISSASAPSLVMAEKAKQTQEEMVITGERVESSLQETASSVVLFNEEYIAQQAGADRIEHILDHVPNMQRGASDLAPTIRGQDATGVLIGANAFLGGTRPRATLQVDGRTLNFNEFVYGLSSIWDVKQIEAFRGPQTTTQGRNAIAGAIFIETNDPTFEFEGAAQAIVGNYDTRQASVALSGPLVEDQLAARIAVDWREHDSWMQYTAPDIFSGADREDDDHALARAKMLFMPNALPELKLLLTYTHLNASTPQGETADAPYGDRIQGVQSGAHWDTDVDSLVVNADYAFSSDWKTRFTGTYADSRSERFAAPGLGSASVSADESSIEGLIRFDPAQGRMRAMLGIAYFTADQDETSDLSAFLGLGDFTDSQHSRGIFGQATFDLNTQLHFTLGGRWQEDEQDRSGTLGPVSLDYHETFSAFLPKAEISYDYSHDITVGVTARKGYTPGGTTLSFVTGDIDVFDAETLWSYELFSRATLADGHVILSGNIFYTDFKDTQRPLIEVITLPDGTSAETIELSNAPSAKNYGLEVQSTWIANSMLQVRASLGYLESEISETRLPNDPMLGKKFQRAPQFSGVLGLNWLANEKLSVDLNIRRNSEYFSDDANTPDFKIEGVTLVDAKANYDFGLFNVFTFVRNATDESYPVWQFVPGNASLGDPREYGIGIHADF